MSVIHYMLQILCMCYIQIILLVLYYHILYPNHIIMNQLFVIRYNIVHMLYINHIVSLLLPRVISKSYNYECQLLIICYKSCICYIQNLLLVFYYCVLYSNHIVMNVSYSLCVTNLVHMSYSNHIVIVLLPCVISKSYNYECQLFVIRYRPYA